MYNTCLFDIRCSKLIFVFANALMTPSDSPDDLNAAEPTLKTPRTNSVVQFLIHSGSSHSEYLMVQPNSVFGVVNFDPVTRFFDDDLVEGPSLR